MGINSSIYEPAEDSELLIKHTKKLNGSVLEIGCGSGVVCLTNAVENPGNNVIGTDLNPEAVEYAKESAAKRKIKNVGFSVSDLFGNVEGTFDYVLFNPPYLPTDESTKVNGSLNSAFDGGKDGRKIVDRFLEQFEGHLKENGEVFLIQSSLNKPEKTIDILERKGFGAEVVDQEAFFFEKIYLIRARRKTKIDKLGQTNSA